MPLLDVKSVEKIYTTRLGNQNVRALKNVTFTVEQGEFIAIMGESGSGKTTLLNILAALDKATRGDVFLDDVSLGSIKEKSVAEFRRNNLGFIFQEFNLLDNFSNEDNIFLPLVLAGKSYEHMAKRIKPIVEKLNIAEIMKKYPYEISGGQKQRVAVARALITSPKLILADEPTGALDSKSSEQLLSMFTRLNREGQTILMVTHSIQAACKAGRVLFIKDGQVFHQIYRGTMRDGEMYEKISSALTAISLGGGSGE